MATPSEGKVIRIFNFRSVLVAAISALLSGVQLPPSAFATDYSIHPVLHTKEGAGLGDRVLPLSVFEELRWLEPDPNYFKHERAEREAAEQYCQLAMAGMLPASHLSDDFRETRTTREDHFGFNMIPVELTYINQNCVGAFAAKPEFSPRIMKFAGTLKEPILNTSEFAHFDGILSAEQMKSLPIPPKYLTKYERWYSGHSGCFSLAETEAAVQFRDRLLGKSRQEIFALAGSPAFTIGAVDVLGDKPTVENVVYRIGLRRIPVRLALENDHCIDASLLSHNQEMQIFEWLIRRHAALGRGNTEIEILKKYGDPPYTTINKAGQSVFHYPMGTFMSTAEYTIADGKCVDTALMCTSGGPSGKRLEPPAGWDDD